MVDGNNKKVCMCLYNNFTHDSRVLKEALSLYQAGYSITVIARLDDKTLPFEKKHGITVKRISVNPIHVRLLRLIRKLLKRLIATERNMTQTLSRYISRTTQNKPGKLFRTYQRKQ